MAGRPKKPVIWRDNWHLILPDATGLSFAKSPRDVMWWFLDRDEEETGERWPRGVCDAMARDYLAAVNKAIRGCNVRILEDGSCQDVKGRVLDIEAAVLDAMMVEPSAIIDGYRPIDMGEGLEGQ